MGLLDEIRLNRSVDNFKTIFHDLANSNKQEAIALINDENLHFPSLYILQNEFRKFDLSPYLSVRNRCALEITNEILTRRDAKPQRLLTGNKKENYATLKWMFETGTRDDGLNDQYDEVLEVSAILLIKEFKDNACLSRMIEMIFNRYKKGFYTYDLQWALFESRCPECLLLVANHLRSNDQKEIELARKLLSFIPDMHMDREVDPRNQYNRSRSWINENRKFLVYTGESMNQTSNPRPYIVSLASKYLQIAVSMDTGEAWRVLEAPERSLFDGFKQLDRDSQLLLSHCSSVLHDKNKKWWKQWLSYPMIKQIKIAKKLLEGVS